MISERNLVVLMFLVLTFFLLNFDSNMATVFIAILIAGAYIYFTDKFVILHVEKANNSRIISVAIAFAAYFGFLGVSAIVLKTLNIVGVFSFTSTADIYAQYIGSLYASFSPALADFTPFIVIAWGIIIPIVETFSFFGGYFEWFTEIFNAQIKLRAIRPYLVIILVSIIFMAFHLTAKGLTNNTGLLMTFFFGIVSCVLVLWRGQLLEAILLHIITNTTSILMSKGISLGSPFFIGAIIVGVLIYLLTSVRIVDKIVRWI